MKRTGIFAGSRTAFAILMILAVGLVALSPALATAQNETDGLRPRPGAIVGWVGNAEDHESIEGAQISWASLVDDILDIDWRTPGSALSDPAATALSPADSESLNSVFSEDNFVLTDSDGRYETPDLRHGVYVLLVKAEGFASARRLVVVPPGRTVAADFLLRPDVQEFGSVAGVVTNARTDEPLEGVSVWAVPRGPSIAAALRPAIVLGSTETDENGHYILEDLPAGPVTIYAALRGYRTAGQSIEIPPNDTATADFALWPCFNFEFGDIAGIVYNPSSNLAIPHAVVTLRPADNVDFETHRRLDLKRRVVTDKEGFFYFRNVPVGDYTLSARARGYESANVPAGVVEDEVTKVLIPLNMNPNPPTGEIVGVVTDEETGLPLPCVTIKVQLADGSALRGRWGELKTHTDENGAYSIPEAPAGPCVVYALRRGYVAEKQEVEVPADGSVACDFALLPITAGGTVHGLVRDALTGEPIENCLIVAPHLNLHYPTNTNNSNHDRTDENGAYRIESVPPGDQIIVAIAAAYYQDAQLAEVKANASTAVDFDLIPKRRLARLCIRACHGGNGNPLRGLALGLAQSDWLDPDSLWNPWRCTTDDSGEGLIDNIDPDGEIVQVHVQGYGAVEAPVPAAGSGRGIAAIPDLERPHVGQPLAIITLRLGWEAPQGNTERLTYQWRCNGVPIPGATEPEIETDAFEPGDVLTCEVSLWDDSGGSSELVAVAESGIAIMEAAQPASAGPYWILFE